MTLIILECAPCDGRLAVAALNVVERDWLVEFVDEQVSSDGLRHDVLFRVAAEASYVFANAAIFRLTSGRAYFVLDTPTLPSYNGLLKALREHGASRPAIHLHDGQRAVISLLLAAPRIPESRRAITIMQALRRARCVLASLESLVGVPRDFNDMRLCSVDDYHYALVSFERRHDDDDHLRLK